MSKDLGRNVYSPGRAVDTTLGLVEDRMKNPIVGIKPMLPGLGDKLDPWMSGDLIGFLAFTSNGKSSVAQYVVNQHGHVLEAIYKKQPDYNHIAVYLSWEQPIEQMIGIDLSRASQLKISDILYGKITDNQLNQLKGHGAKRKTLPIWLIGHSISDKRDRPMLSMPQVTETLMWIEEECHMTIDLVVLDYLQRIRRTKADMREGYMDICDQARTMAIKSPVLLLSQAKREVYGRKWPMPMLDDAQETSNYEQSCTHMFGFWMPCQNKIEKVKVNGKEIMVDDHLLLMETLKQTLGPKMFTTPYNLGWGGTHLRVWGEPEPIEDRFL